MSVVVLGAGIVGLTTADHIRSLLPKVKVTVIADKFNAETTSDGAAGLFLPCADYRGPTPTSAKEWMKHSYKYYESLLNEGCGVFETSGYLFSSENEEDVQNDLMVGVAPEYRAASPQELLQYPGNWKYGTFLRTLIIRCRTFLPWLTEKLTSQGVEIVKRRIHDFRELGQYDVIVNCTGLQSRWLCGDNKVTAVRGQILKVMEPSIDKFYFFNPPDTYVIPFGEGIVSLGGTCQFGVYDTRVRPHDSLGIRERCAAALPSLGSAPVAWEWAGLRPYRETVRVEAETRNNLKIVHNYGHGGYGVTAGPGTARDAAELVKQMLTTHSKL